MKRVVLFISALLAWNVSYGQAAKPSEKPSVKMGDRWAYKTVDLFTNNVTEESVLVVSAVDGDTIRTKTTRSTGGEEEDVYDSQWNGKRVAGMDFSPARQFFAFPLDGGKTWQSRVSYPTLTGDGTVNATLKGIVGAWESVTVPAGTFQAQKITVSNSYFVERGATGAGKRNSGVGQWTIWYAPEVKRFVRLEFDEGRTARNRTELVEYKLN